VKMSTLEACDKAGVELGGETVKVESSRMSIWFGPGARVAAGNRN
jgi:hypothetical protein